MDSKNVVVTGGVKVTYIETQFVTSDMAGFKDLVQRLTGRSAPPPAPAPAPYRPRPCEGTTAAGAGVPQGYHQLYTAAEVRPAVTINDRTPTTYLEDVDLLHDFIDMGDFSDLFYAAGAASERSAGGYGSFPY